MVSSSVKKKKGLLWRIEDREQDSSFLFGTMHVRSSVAHQFVEAVVPYIEGCYIYAGEMDLGGFDHPALMRNSVLPDQRVLTDYISTGRYLKIQKIILKAFGVDLGLMKNRHPFLIVSALSESLLKNDRALALDDKLWHLAKTRDKHCTGLESFEDQINVMQSISVEDSLKSLLQIARNPNRFRKGLLKMVNLYIAQDVRRLYKVSRKQLHELRKILLFNRNVKMAERMCDLMRENSVFSAVGAAHLGGEKGMLRLLQKKGFSVKPIFLDCENSNS